MLVFYLRRYVTEPEIAAAARIKHAEEGYPPLSRSFPARSEDNDPGVLMATGMQGGYYAVTFWVPRFLDQPALSIVSSTGYLAGVIGSSAIRRRLSPSASGGAICS